MHSISRLARPFTATVADLALTGVGAWIFVPRFIRLTHHKYNHGFVRVVMVVSGTQLVVVGVLVLAVMIHRLRKSIKTG